MMQHTEKRGLSIIERDDAFSPEALNDNTRKIEAALDEHEEKVDGQVADLDARIVTLEAHKLVMGTYTGTGSNLEISVGFSPKVVVVFMYGGTATNTGILLEGLNCNVGLRLTEGGFWAANGGNYSQKNGQYFYFAFA